MVYEIDTSTKAPDLPYVPVIFLEPTTINTVVIIFCSKSRRRIGWTNIPLIRATDALRQTNNIIILQTSSVRCRFLFPLLFFNDFYHIRKVTIVVAVRDQRYI